MNYKVLEDLDFRPVLNVHWEAGDVISDWDIDRLFSVSTKEFFILDGKIKGTDHKYPMSQEMETELTKLFKGFREEVDKMIKQLGIK